MNLGHRATVSLVSDPFFLDGKRVFDGSDGSIGVPSEDDPPRARGCYRGVRPLISRHFSQDLWKKPPRTLEKQFSFLGRFSCFILVKLEALSAG